jgi:hypothetical protein
MDPWPYRLLREVLQSSPSHTRCHFPSGLEDFKIFLNPSLGSKIGAIGPIHSPWDLTVSTQDRGYLARKHGQANYFHLSNSYGPMCVKSSVSFAHHVQICHLLPRCHMALLRGWGREYARLCLCHLVGSSKQTNEQKWGSINYPKGTE